MKNPIRNVVVEYKNRRARKNTNSLWGNLDLKSIAREVEEDAPQAAPDLQPHSNATEIPVVAAVVEPIREVLKEPEALQDKPETVQKSRKAVVAPSREARAKKPDLGNRVKKAAVTRTAGAKASVVTPDIMDELATLEAENAELKLRLAAKLRLENLELQKILARAHKRQTETY